MRKSLLCLSLMTLSVLALLTCLWAEPTTQPSTQSTNSNVKDPAMKRILVVYFSHSGNTREIANQIHDLAGGDIFEIVPVNPYPKDYDTVVDQAAREKRAAARPKLKNKLENPADYDVVFVGYPNWWNTFPMPVATFLAETDLAGKTLVPFCTHEGSGLGGSVEDLAKLCPKSKILSGIAIRGHSVKSARKDVAAWLAKLNLPKTQQAATQSAGKNN